MIIGLIFLGACTKKLALHNAKWMLGTWENKTSRGSVFETWTMENDRAFLAKSYKIQEADTILFETVQLIIENNQLFYIPKVVNQNEGKPVRFSMTSMSDSSMTFENPIHDFPQIITYSKIGRDSLVATISGIRNGKESKRYFRMKRVD